MGWIVGLNSLRFFASMLVMIYHAFGDFLPGGFLAIEFFFVVSGYLLVSKALKNGKFNFLPFLKKRILRMWPMLAAMVAIVVFLAQFASKTLLAGLQFDSVFALLFSTNLAEYFGGGSYEDMMTISLFRHCWFVAMEFQLSILLGLIFKFFADKTLKKFFVSLLTLSGLSLALMWFYGVVMGEQSRAYYFPDTQIFSFLMGASLAVWRRGKRTRKNKIDKITVALSVVYFLLVAKFVHFSNVSTFAVFLPLSAVVSVLLLNALLNLQRKRFAPPAVIYLAEFLGRYSYGIYLFHWPILLLFERCFGMSAITAIIVSLVLAIFCTELMRMTKWSPRIAASLAVILVIMTFVNFPQKSPIMTELESVTKNETSFKVVYVNNLEIDNFAKQEIEKFSQLTEKSPELTEAPRSANEAKVLIIGDSVTLGAKTALEGQIEGVFVDAEESRGVEKAKIILDTVAASGKIPQTVVVSLITNERTITDELLQSIVDSARGSHVVFVTGYAGLDQPRIEQNEIIRTFATKTNNVDFADWWQIASLEENSYLLYDDHIHLNIEGREKYAELIRDVILRTEAE